MWSRISSTASSAAVMGSKPRIPVPTAARRLRRRSSYSNRRPPSKPQAVRHRRSTHVGGATAVSDKLAALKNLVPSQNKAETKADQLFRETADYIVLLETQVLVLQKLVDFYGSQPQEKQDHVNLNWKNKIKKNWPHEEKKNEVFFYFLTFFSFFNIFVG